MSRKPNEYHIKEFYKNITQKYPLRLGHQFVVEFFGAGLNDMSTAGFGINTKDDLKFTYYVQSTSIPQVDIGSAHVNYMAAGFEVPGVIKYPDNWSVEIIIDQGMTQYTRLRNWQEAISSYRLNSGGYKVIPNVSAHVNLLDSTMTKIVKTYVMEGAWIESLGDLQFKYNEGSSEIKKCSCNFAFQYWYELDGEGDPLFIRSNNN